MGSGYHRLWRRSNRRDLRASVTPAGADRLALLRVSHNRLGTPAPGVQPLIALGQSTLAGETVLADFASDEPARIGRTG